MSLDDCALIELPKVADPRGNLTFLDGGRQIPFAIKRVFYLYDVPGGEMRAGHALKSCYQFIIAASGSFDVTLNDGHQKQRYPLNRPYKGLLVPPLIWREIDDFSSGSVCLVLASEYFDEADYYREYSDFLQAVRGQAR